MDGVEGARTRGLVLETERLRLMPPDACDCAAIAALANNARVAENMSRMPHPYNEGDARAWLDAQRVSAADEIIFGLYLKGRPRRFIGAAGITRLDGPEPDLGYWLGEPYWGVGYATEAAHAVIDYAFATAGHTRLVAGCRVTNRASRRVLEKCGFQYSGDGMIASCYFRGSMPTRRYRLDHRVWTSLKDWGRIGFPHSALPDAGATS